MITRVLIAVVTCLIGLGASAEGVPYGQNAHLDELFATLQSSDGARAESEIMLIFRQSGSDAMDVILARGYNSIHEGKQADAVWHFSALIDHAPDFAEGYAGRALAFFNLGEPLLAMQDIKTALALNPRHFVALAGLGSVHIELGNSYKALAAYRMAFSLNPHFEGLAETIEQVESQLSFLH